MRVLVTVSLLGAFVLALTVTNTAAAGGIEYTGAGTQSLGRGGAVAARADDPMVLLYNPAGLVELRGSQLMLNANLALMNACVDPIGYYGWGAYSGGQPSRIPDPKGGPPLMLNLGASNAGAEAAYYNGRLDTVCLNQGIQPVPWLAFTARLGEKFGIGLGLMYPAAMPQGSWGDQNTGVIRNAAGELRPAATRYQQINSGTTGMFPTLGLAYRAAKWVRLGASFEWGVINVDNTSMAVVAAGTSPGGDIIAHVRATDWFVPAVNASLHFVPFDALDVVFAFRWQDALKAPGTIDLTTGVFDPTKLAHTKTDEVIAVNQKFPWKVRTGVRYASRLAPRPSGAGHEEARGLNGERIHDAFEDERWDLEFDAEYQRNSLHQDLIVDYLPGQSAEFQALDGTITTGSFPDPTRTYSKIPKRWSDQTSWRVGGSYNVLPGFLGFSFGANYENRGLNPDYMQIDYWPVQRIGVHVGVKMRIARSIDFVASYGHIFQETLVVGAPMHDTGENISKAYTAAMNNEDAIRAVDKRVGFMASRSDPPPPVLEENPKPTVVDGTARVAQVATKAPSNQPPVIINTGTYRSGIDVFSAGINVHF